MANTPPDEKPVAVFVCHGMGQQVPFETIDSVARSLSKAVAKENESTDKDPPKIKVNIVSFPEGERLPRAELQFKAADGTARAVHIYEAYWAPLTEGKVSLRDVMSFLLSAGIGGLWQLIKFLWNAGVSGLGQAIEFLFRVKVSFLSRKNPPFTRWMFRGWKPLGRPALALVWLTVALLVVLSLIVMNSTIVAVAAARALTQAQPAWPSNPLVANLTMTFSILLIAVAGLVVVFCVVLWRHRQHQKANEGWTLDNSWLQLWEESSVIAVWVNIAVALLVGAFLIVLLNGWWATWRPAWDLLGVTIAVVVMDVLVIRVGIILLQWSHRRHSVIAVGGNIAAAILVGALLFGFPFAWLAIVLMTALVLCAACSFARWLSCKPYAVWVAILVGYLLIAIVQLTDYPFMSRAISIWKWLGEWQSMPRLVVAMVWGTLVIASYFVRKLLVQYVGDVVAYVSAHEASKFCEIRTAIHKTALNVAKTIYAAKNEHDNNKPLYDRIVVVGHSLGSVVAYDTLNALILGDRDRLDETRFNAAERTKMFLTFGSPLDKTAYIFRNHTAINAEVREQLSAEVQPMICDYKYRPKKWVNLYSHHDWISGALEYYDDRSQTEHKEKFIDNVIDPYACVHVMAHTQYWAGYQFAIHLYEGVTGKIAVKLRKEEVALGVKSDATAREKMDGLPQAQS